MLAPIRDFGFEIAVGSDSPNSSSSISAISSGKVVVSRQICDFSPARERRSACKAGPIERFGSGRDGRQAAFGRARRDIPPGGGVTAWTGGAGATPGRTEVFLRAPETL
jgi:hypothetical protein